jgi:hypothetical protein
MIHIALFAALLQTAPAPPQAAAPPAIDCTDARHTAFDFWLGDWEVRPTGTDVVVATSVISRAAGGCAIEENYHQTMNRAGGPIDYRGQSLSVFDQANGGKWRQFYISSGGSVTAFEGHAVDGAIVLDAPGAGGAMQRMTVAPQADGSVRQWGQTSTDGGRTWSAAGYDFTYRRRGG